MPNFLAIFKKAVVITWKNKYLWWFGFFVALTNFGGANFFFDDSAVDEQNGEKIMQYLAQNIQLIIWVGVALLILWLVLVMLGFVGRAALISSIEKHSKGETLGFRRGLAAGCKNFWKIFSFSVALFSAMLFLLIITFVPVALLFISSRPISGIFMAALAVLIILPLSVLFFYLKIFGWLYAILGQLKFWSALESAYNLFRRNLLASLAMGLIFISINIVLFFLILMMILPLAIVFLPLGGLVFLAIGKTGAFLVAGMASLIFLVFALIIKSAYEVFAMSAWVFFFEEIAKPKAEEKITAEEKEAVEIPKALPVVECKKE